MEGAASSPLYQVLLWVGYSAANARVLEEEFGDLSTMGSASQSEVTDVLRTYAQRSTNAGRVVSGLVKTKRIQALTNWVRDFDRLGDVATIVGLDQDTFLDGLHTAAQRAAAREADKATAEARAKEAAPGKLTSEKDWERWETKFINQLSILQGVMGVPLAYVTREKIYPDDTQTYGTFAEESIAKCPLEGPFFEADARTVHQRIAALKRKVPTADSSEESSDEPSNDAGNAFGGRSEKAKRKKNSS